MEFHRKEQFGFYCILIIFIFSLTSISFAEEIDKNYNANHRFNLKGQRYCVACHVPGENSISNDNAPKWFEASETKNFESFSKNKNKIHSGYPSGESKLCLGCHDGIVAKEDENFYSATSENHFNGPSYPGGFSLNHSHPVSIPYNSYTAMKNKHLADPSFERSGLGGTIEEDMLENGMITCTTCHNIHSVDEGENAMNNHFNGSEGGYTMTLKIPIQGSALCLTCHKI